MGIVNMFRRLVATRQPVPKVQRPRNRARCGQKPASIRHKLPSHPVTAHKPTYPKRKCDSRPGKCSQRQALIVFHGTPSAENARSIMRHGWLAGSGNALGDGLYLSTNLDEAKGYAGLGGVIVKCAFLPKRECWWNTDLAGRFSRWCTQNGVQQDNSARTAFLRREGFDVLRQGSIVVILRAQFANPSAYKFRPRGLRILGVYRADTGERIRI